MQTNIELTQKDFYDVGQSMLDEHEKSRNYRNLIDIYSFFEVFYDLVNQLDLGSQDPLDYQKITLREEYPDVTYKEGTVVIYKINERNFFEPTSVVRPKGSEQRKPLTLRSSSDIITNNIIDDLGYYFCNNIEFEVVSNSIKHLHTVIKLLETICLRHKKHLKVYVQDIMYKGQSDLEYSDKYFEKRLFSKSIHLEVITCETYSIVSEELKFIGIT